MNAKLICALIGFVLIAAAGILVATLTSEVTTGIAMVSAAALALTTLLMQSPLNNSDN